MWVPLPVGVTSLFLPSLAPSWAGVPLLFIIFQKTVTLIGHLISIHVWLPLKINFIPIALTGPFKSEKVLPVGGSPCPRPREILSLLVIRSHYILHVTSTAGALDLGALWQGRGRSFPSGLPLLMLGVHCQQDN